ncbi:hypothetical protein P9X10_00540 [Bacillus cereus]|nr:hypothetical protein [Bacillus cereus]
MFGSRSNVFHLNSVKLEETKRKIELPFDYIQKNEKDFGTIMVQGKEMFTWVDVNEVSTPSTFENDRLALKDTNLKTREYFTFPTMLDVKCAVEEIVLEDERLVVTVKDVSYNRKLKVSMYAPDWLVEKYS